MKPKLESDVENTVSTVRGKPKSGRVWKEQRLDRHSTFMDKSVKSKWKSKAQRKTENNAVKQLERSLKEERAKRKMESRQRQEENTKRRLENERKGETVQIVLNAAKLKRIKKKQLRQIKKI